MTLVMMSGLQEAMKREDRLADEPFGPERPSSFEDYRAFYEAADISEGDVISWFDGATSVVEAIVPALSSEVTWADEILHLRTTNPDGSESTEIEFDEGIGQFLSRGECSVEEVQG